MPLSVSVLPKVSGRGVGRKVDNNRPRRRSPASRSTVSVPRPPWILSLPAATDEDVVTAVADNKIVAAETLQRIYACGSFEIVRAVRARERIGVVTDVVG